MFKILEDVRPHLHEYLVKEISPSHWIKTNILPLSDKLYAFAILANIIKKCTNIYICEHINVKLFLLMVSLAVSYFPECVTERLR